MTRRIYTTGEAAEICGLSLSTLKRWIKRGALRSYRTPGGDIRIPHEHLRDFMREFEIPLYHLEETVSILMAMADRALSRRLRESFETLVPGCEVELTDSGLDLGFKLSQVQPAVVVLSARETEPDSLALCRQVRTLLTPAMVRLGMVNVEREFSRHPDRPDMILQRQPGAGEIDEFVHALLGDQAQPSAGMRRRSA